MMDDDYVSDLCDLKYIFFIKFIYLLVFSMEGSLEELYILVKKLCKCLKLFDLVYMYVDLENILRVWIFDKIICKRIICLFNFRIEVEKVKIVIVL